MDRIFLALGRIILSVLLLVSFTCAQQSSPSESLADVAREQKEIRRQHEKNGETPKVLTNDDLAARSGTSTSAGAETRGASSTAPELQSKEPKQTRRESQSVDGESKDNLDVRPPVGSVLDRAKDSRPDVIVVPAGTEVKVNIGEHKTIAPIRVGFSTPIPALSQVTVQVTRSYVDVPYSYSGAPNGAYVDYVEYATLTAVTVAGKTYQVETDSLPIINGGTDSELTFTLGGPVEVLR
jgi:hypothetical protein